MKRTLWLPMALVVTVSLLLGVFACAAPAPSSAPAAAPAAAPVQAVTLNWVSYAPETDTVVRGFKKYVIDAVAEKSKGRLVFNYRGGPEAIPPTDQPAAVRSGLVDLATPPVGFYDPLVPGVGTLGIATTKAAEQRRNGAYDYLLELHKKAGFYYLGRTYPTEQPYFYTLLKKRVEKPEELKALKLGSVGIGRVIVQSWGATLVGVAMPEYYSSMQTGVVDGIGIVPIDSAADMRLHEVTKYIIDHPIGSSTTSTVMNLNSFNRLPSDLQSLLTEAAVDLEKNMERAEVENRAAARKKFTDSGAQFYKLSPDFEKWFVETAYQASWKDYSQRLPDVAPRLKELLSK